MKKLALGSELNSMYINIAMSIKTMIKKTTRIAGAGQVLQLASIRKKPGAHLEQRTPVYSGLQLNVPEELMSSAADASREEGRDVDASREDALLIAASTCRQPFM
jgi:hypothetical protein